MLLSDCKRLSAIVILSFSTTTGCATSVSRGLNGLGTLHDKLIMSRVTATLHTNMFGANTFDRREEYFLCSLYAGNVVDCVPATVRVPEAVPRMNRPKSSDR